MMSFWLILQLVTIWAMACAKCVWPLQVKIVARVITCVYEVSEDEGQIILLTIYDKQEKENISEAELRQLKAEVRAMLGL